MSEGSKKRLFRSCKSCGKARLYSEDPHKECLYWLYPKHVTKECKYCRTFSAKTLKDREARLLLWLQEKKAALDTDSEEKSKGYSSKHKRESSEEKLESKKMKTEKKTATSLPPTPLKKV